MFTETFSQLKKQNQADSLFFIYAPTRAHEISLSFSLTHTHTHINFIHIYVHIHKYTHAQTYIRTRVYTHRTKARCFPCTLAKHASDCNNMKSSPTKKRFLLETTRKRRREKCSDRKRILAKAVFLQIHSAIVNTRERLIKFVNAFV